MSHRIVPATFWASALLIVAVLLVPGTTGVAGRSYPPPNNDGIWDGFYLAPDGVTGLVSSDIHQRKSRQLMGDGVLFDLPNGDVEYEFRAALSRSGSLHGTGEASSKRFTVDGEVAIFAGRSGDAGVMTSEYRFRPSRGGPSLIRSLLLHPFSDVASTDISGFAEGPFVSHPDPITGEFSDPNFKGVGKVEFLPRNSRNSFGGNVQLFLDPDEPATLSWPLLATTSDDRRVIWIAQGRTGSIIYDGVIIPPRNADSNTFMGGFFRLNFNDGRSLYNTFNFTISR